MDIESIVPENIKLNFLIELNKISVNKSYDKITKLYTKCIHKYKKTVKKIELIQITQSYENIIINDNLKKWLIKKPIRSSSGINNATIILKPLEISCKEKCLFCFFERSIITGLPIQPKSYLSTEPATRRAQKLNFDVKLQIYDRLDVFALTGNIIEKEGSKLEVVISGGTFESYPLEYRNQVFIDLFNAANSYKNNLYKSCNDLNYLKHYNTHYARHKIIGITVETRPDYINDTTIRLYSNWGVTRVQLGVQHTNNAILDYNGRGSTIEDFIEASKRLRANGFKLVVHIMPDLYKSSPSIDMQMFKDIIKKSHNDLYFDDIKIYPTAIIKSNDPSIYIDSELTALYNSGQYKPYAEFNLNLLINILKYYKNNISRHVRIQRIVRDIPGNNLIAGYDKCTNLRDHMKNMNIKCNCIRCHEIKNNTLGRGDFIFKCVEKVYSTDEGIEYFISYQVHSLSFMLIIYFIYYYFILIINFFMFNQMHIFFNPPVHSYKYIIGFCRLRINKNISYKIFPVLRYATIVRELHVYSNTIAKGSTKSSLQHTGYGTQLMLEAEKISLLHKYNKIAVIAGVGARDFYKNKLNYVLQDDYMIKEKITGIAPSAII